MKPLSLFCFLALIVHSTRLSAEEYDVVIYGGTSAGIIAGIQALEMGKTTIVIEPTARIGGLTTGGLGQTDIGNKQAIGGLSREFYERVAKYYTAPEVWNWQDRSAYRDSGQTRTAEGEATMWTFEPSAALKIYEDWITETGLEVVKNERLDRSTSKMEWDGGKIVSITMESGRKFKGKMFIDATYEGDLLAAASVVYTVGREATFVYDETLNGVQTERAKSHNFVDGVDPYRIAGDPNSGLLPFIDPNGPGTEGGGDDRVQAYCFRMCLTDHPENRIPFAKPDGYDETWYELLLRNFEAGENGMPWINSSMPNRKTDTNNRTGFSTDFIGQNYAYPQASYSEREAIVERHRQYQKGLMWTLANHPRVPEKIRREVARWGTCKDEFAAEDGWQAQLYIREGRRMVSDFVMTQNHCQQNGKVEKITDAIGMGAYTMDSHNTQRYVTEAGFVKNEGDIQVGGFPPYPIAYRSIVPKKSEAENLLVPVSLSASHLAFGSIRMEPVFMVLGQSAATAASLAIDAEVAVQDLDYAPLGDRLLADGQTLKHVAPPKPRHNYVSLDNLEGTVVDDSNAKLTGEWIASTLPQGIHQGYLHDNAGGSGMVTATFSAKLPKPGQYEVQVAYSPNSNRATQVPITIVHADGEAATTINQRKTPRVGNLFEPVGRYEFDQTGSVTISNAKAEGHVVIDAVRWLPVE